MPRSRVPAALALVLALVGAASSALSATASAATGDAAQQPVGTITIVSADTEPVAGGVQLSVTADSEAPIVTMNAHMLDATTSNDVLDLAMNPPAGGPVAGETTWTVTLTVGTPPTGLPLGNYDVTVDATDQDGSTLPAGPTVATLPFVAVPTITPHPVSSVVSYDNQRPAISGTVTVLTPGVTVPEPYADQQIFVADSTLPGGGATVTTSPEGDYSYTFANPAAGETFTVEVLPTGTVAAATALPVTFSIHVDAVTMTAALSAKTVTYGGKVTVSGSVTYKPGGTFMPLHGVTVQVFYNRVVGNPVATAVTDVRGHFTATLPKEAISTHWVLRVSGRYLATSTVTLPLRVNLPTIISGFQASLSQLWQLSFRGCLALRAGVPRSIPSLSGLIIQYSAGPNGPWRTLGAVPKQNSVACGNGGRSFSGTLTAKLNYAYYRARYAGSTDSSGTGYLAAVSGRVLAWKYQDRITGFRVSSRTVPKGGKLTVSGQLQYFSVKWRDYAKQPVYVILRPKGNATWFYIAIATTNSTGHFSARFTDPVTATWSAEFFGNSSHLAAQAGQINVTLG